MKRLLFFTATLVFLAGTARSQSYKYIYYLDKDFASVDSANALFIGKGYDDNGLFGLDGFDKNTGQLFTKMHFVDSTLGNMQGFFQSFYPDGKLESEGNYQNSMEQGVWTKWDSTGLKTDSLIFDKGEQTGNLTFSYYQNTNLKTVSFYNSVARVKDEVFYNDSGIKEKEVKVEGDSAVAFYYHNGDLIKRELLNSTEVKESEFPGGMAAFKQFLERNLNALTPTDHNAPFGTYNVIVRFVVSKDGTISDIVPETNFGYGMEAEVIRVFKLSPKWSPAIQYGIPVNAYHRQPVTFVVSDGKIISGMGNYHTPAGTGSKSSNSRQRPRN